MGTRVPLKGTYQARTLTAAWPGRGQLQPTRVGVSANDDERAKGFWCGCCCGCGWIDEVVVVEGGLFDW